LSTARHFILGAAGHVDHGKTTLITALTGTHTDRLKEEQERGISIELGFAELDLDDDVKLGVVDMPGHEKFVKQMVSGAGGVDLAFLLVAADEGVMPQTIEHLEIMNSLGVASGVVVMSKADMVDEEILAVATEEAMELVEGTFLEGKPIVAVSAQTGEGLDELKATLKEVALALPHRKEEGTFRMPIDRAFTLPGAGVVVTGTCWSGAVKVGDKLTLEPGGEKVRIREVQVHGAKAERGASGQRLALALHGVKKEDISRGFQLVSPDSCAVTRRLDLRVNVMAHYRGVIKNRQRLHVNHAGREVLARIVLLDEEELGGEGGARSGLAQLHLEDDLIAAREDRLVLRFYSPVTSIAGGVVLDANPQRHKRFDEQAQMNLTVMESGDPVELFRQNLHQAGTDGLALADAMGQEDDPSAQLVGKRLYDRELMINLATQITEKVDDYAERFPLRLGIPKEECRRKCKFKAGPNEWHAICVNLSADAKWEVIDDRIGQTASGPLLSSEMKDAIAQATAELRAFGLNWPGLEGWAEASPTFRNTARVKATKAFEPAEVIRHLVDHGVAIGLSNEFYIASEGMEDVLAKLREYFTTNDAIAFGEFRELTGLTRKLGIPLLEYLDANGRTQRDGDVRRAGPSLVDR
jgi:selenocysteine-specific elongation factor